MFLLYSFLYTIGFLVMLPLFVFRRKKYAPGFLQKFGYIGSPADDRPVIWIHCVSVGEANAALPIVDELLKQYPQYCLVVSTTTATGQKLAKEIFAGKAVQVFYFPYDWRLSVRRALRRVKPCTVLILETEIWLNFFRETSKSGAHVFIVNGRLSKRSARRYAWVKGTIKRTLHYVTLALMQDHKDAKRFIDLGIRSSKVKVTGNLKFDQKPAKTRVHLTEKFKERFGIDKKAPLVVAASTHSPEERIILKAFKEVWKKSNDALPRLLIAPRHPERFAEVEKMIRGTGFDWVKRSEYESNRDKVAEVILLDSIGELRNIYPLAEIVFVGGSLTPHGGQSMLEPAFEGKAIVTGAYTENFRAIVNDFVENEALIQLPEVKEDAAVTELKNVFYKLLGDEDLCKMLARNALRIARKNGGAASRTIEYLSPYLTAENNDQSLV